ncbi:hypothetical protein D9757_001294 [Collybiopsis confluens]|uniref:Phosphatidylglycerol lysyltransferase C-terminal domain-containing protein n=1 Tax=Collybiopsis confluens TaxID=2823264 RepID=A0A8H5I162_9AGAR|nr:hypothetical protein D9757_001294 [Collybiopsis confluens]
MVTTTHQSIYVEDFTPSKDGDLLDLFDGEAEDALSTGSGSDTDGFPLSSSATDATYAGFDKSSISSLVASHGSSSATAWLEFDRYRIWQANRGQIKESSFLPVQGYMQRKKYVFAWGDPLVSSPAALRATAEAFIAWANSQNLRPIWCCVDVEMEKVLASLGWSGVMCIHEEIIHPDHVLEMTSDKVRGHEGVGVVKDLKKNLRRAERAGVIVEEITGRWKPEDRTQVEDGMLEWRRSKGLKGVQLASTAGQPWIDEEHRRYWVARWADHIVGVLILTPIHGPHAYLIKNAVSFPSAPRGTSEHLIHTALQAIQNDEKHLGFSITVTFGITASDHLTPVDNLKGWKITSLSKVYEKVAKGAGLLRRGEFRGKFDSEREEMYVCYPEDGLGLEGIRNLLKVLQK